MKLRLLKVIVQPVFVLDDGEDLREERGQAVEVPASSWRDFGATSFNKDEMHELEQQVSNQPGNEVNGRPDP